MLAPAFSGDYSKIHSSFCSMNVLRIIFMFFIFALSLGARANPLSVKLKKTSYDENGRPTEEFLLIVPKGVFAIISIVPVLWIDRKGDSIQEFENKYIMLSPGKHKVTIGVSEFPPINLIPNGSWLWLSVESEKTAVDMYIDSVLKIKRINFSRESGSDVFNLKIEDGKNTQYVPAFYVKTFKSPRVRTDPEIRALNGQQTP